MLFFFVLKTSSGKDSHSDVVVHLADVDKNQDATATRLSQSVTNLTDRNVAESHKFLTEIKNLVSFDIFDLV